MSSHLGTRPFTTAAMLGVYGDRTVLRHALAFESALARAGAEAGLIEATDAEAIGRLCAGMEIDPAGLAEEATFAGTLAIPLVRRLREALVEQPSAAQAIHKGATSQDLADTVMMMQARDALVLLEADLQRITGGLAAIATRHARTPAVGKTLLQDAMPVTFGLRAAQWLSGVASARARLRQTAGDAILLQFGGAAGTLAGLDGKGAAVAGTMGEILGLTVPPAPWHSRRDGVAGLASALGILVGSLGKVARDIALLAQNSVGEVHEPDVQGRGGSSAMPHKRNPVSCQIALSAAVRAPGLVASILSGMPQELERGLGGWQAEAPVLAELFMLAGGSTNAMAAAVEGLDVKEDAMARNLDAAGIGNDEGEAEAMVAAILARFGDPS